MMGLIIASAADNRDGITTVWSKVISVDMVDKWSVWIKSTPPPSRATLVQGTVFGQLWKLVQEQQPVEVHSSMQYDASLEDMVLRKLTLLDRGAAWELKRLLSRTTSVVLLQSVVAGKLDEQKDMNNPNETDGFAGSTCWIYRSDPQKTSGVVTLQIGQACQRDSTVLCIHYRLDAYIIAWINQTRKYSVFSGYKAAGRQHTRHPHFPRQAPATMERMHTL